MGSRYFPARTVLFEKERNGVTYRVPSLLYMPRSATLLAFAEERLSTDDAHANLLVLRQGTFYKTYVEWGDLRAIDTALLKKHRSMNPCPLYDEFTGTIFLFFIAVLGKIPESYQIITGQNLARLCYVSSSDQGHSWSAVTDLTKQVIGGSIKEWATFALGPGHGIQLKSGRLVVPAYTYHIDCTQCFGTLCKTTPHSFTFYSDDHGRSWKFGDFIPNLETVECQVVSVDEEDGTNILYCNARSPLGFRVQALSMDDGARFYPGQLVQKLVESQYGCHGSIIGFPAPFALHGTLPHNGWSINSQDDLNLYGKLRRLQTLHHDGQTKDIECLSTASLCSKILGCPQQQTRSKVECSCTLHGDSVFEDSICGAIVHKECVNGNVTEEDSMPGGSAHRDIVCENCSHGCNLHDSPTVNIVCRFQGYPKPSPSIQVSALFQNPTWVLYSHPTSPTSRVNLGVYLSTFPRDADSWTDPWVIYEGPSAYSDMAYIEVPSSAPQAMGAPTIAFACLFENGVRSPYEQISFSIFTLYEVIQNIPMKSTSELIQNLPITFTHDMMQSIPVKSSSEAFQNIPVKSKPKVIQIIPVKSISEVIQKVPVKSSSSEEIQTTPMKSASQVIHNIPVKANSEIIQIIPMRSTNKVGKNSTKEPTSPHRISLSGRKSSTCLLS